MNRVVRRVKRDDYRRQGNIVLHKYSAIYFFIPKNASTTIKYMCRNLLEIDPADPKHPELYVHEVNFPCIRSGETSSYRDYYKFAIVRNPYSRLVSCYKEKILKTPRTDRWFKGGVGRSLLKHGKTFYCNMPFNEFASAVCGVPDTLADVHFKSQYLFLPISDGSLMLDFVGRFEALETDLNSICSALGVPSTRLPHLVNTRTGNDYQHYYDCDLVKRVGDRYRKDLDCFDYRF